MRRKKDGIVLFVAASLLLACTGRAPGQGGGPPPWPEQMRKVHERFKGTPGTLALFGDSITVSMAFWAPLAGEPRGMDPDTAKDHQWVKAYLKPENWSKWRGPKYGNNGSMTIRWAHENIHKWLGDLNPETAVILFGTNDLNALGVKEYEVKLGEVVDACMLNGTVVILTTPPPRHGMLKKSEEFALAVRRVAQDRQVPLVDYHQEILKRRPDDWDGALPKFKDVPGGEYEVPTLLARDGVHPSNPRAHQDMSPESLSKNGYMLRNYLTLRAYAAVVREVLQPKKTKDAK